ncbi:hypothetical protein DTO021D3_6322 [Paecilomyces variotii]|nr:hypothetical protein DTO032I3_3453 [Paecilomyces variotii]KAJ9276885.1 hypothetical protein DTO021D3_6322 [Paecilomyces variotii]
MVSDSRLSQQGQDRQAKTTNPILQDVAAMGRFVADSFRHPLETANSVGPTLSELTLGFVGESFVPERDIRDLTGQVVFVTGGNAGLGKETILQLARHRPACIYLGARNEDKARDAIADIQAQLSSPVEIKYVPLDLASFKSIHAAAERFTAECHRLDLLILNAGIMAHDAVTTEDGFEIQFGTNHVGHFLLTQLLLPTLLRTVKDVGPAADVRVITLSSVAHKAAPGFDVMTSTPALLGSNTWLRYGASKAANILFAAELARRYPEITSVSVHPGAVASNLYETAKASNSVQHYAIATFSGLAMRSVRTGAFNQLWAAGVSRESLINGAYYTPVGIVQKHNRYATDAELGKRLWAWTDEAIGKASKS